jgi:hypothetical protein
MLLGYVFLAFGIFVILRIQEISTAFLNLIQAPATETPREIYSSLINELPDSQYSRYILIGGTWALVGIIVYLGYWLVSETITIISNDLTYEFEYTNKAELPERVTLKLWQAIFAVLLVGGLALTIMLGIPLWLSLLDKYLNATFAVSSLPYALASLAGGGANLYLLGGFARTLIRIS